MKPKDHVIQATDLLARVASILIRIDYANAMQTRRNVRAAGELLADAIEKLGAADDATADVPGEDAFATDTQHSED